MKISENKSAKVQFSFLMERIQTFFFVTKNISNNKSLVNLAKSMYTSLEIIYICTIS